MNKNVFIGVLSVLSVLCSCSKALESPGSGTSNVKKVSFDITVTRDGKPIEDARRGIMTKGSYESSDNNISTMDKDIPFGLVGIDFDHHALVVDNAKVNSNGTHYNAFLDSFLWEDLRTESISLSAYYPYVPTISYCDDYQGYVIPYSIEETSAGPLVSKTVEMAIAQLNITPLEFRHITNDIGYRICDVTPEKAIQGLVHLRKLTAYNVASAGVFVNNIALSRGIWHCQGYYRNVVVFEGDAKVGVGSENELFVGFDTLEERMVNSHRYYSVPDEIYMGKQYVEVIYDVEGFTLNGFYHGPLEGMVARYPLYGILPDNVFVYGKQYTFHIGIDLSSIYSEITFAPSVSDWETKIYEDNENF